MDKDREAALARECREGDRQALETLVREFEKPVYNAAYRMLGNPDEAADVTQSVFLKVFENIGRFDPKRRLFSWIYRIALNESIDHINRRKRLSPLPESAGAEDAAAEREVEASQLSREVQAVLLELSEDQRAVIVLRYFTECSYRRIGEILELPEKTVKSRLFTARQQMKERLRAHGVLSP